MSTEYNDRPVIPSGMHKLVQDKYLVPTNEIRKLYTKVAEWIEDRAPGGIIYGFQRRGKTEAIKYVRDKLKEQYNDELPIFLYQPNTSSLRMKKYSMSCYYCGRVICFRMPVRKIINLID